MNITSKAHTQTDSFVKKKNIYYRKSWMIFLPRILTDLRHPLEDGQVSAVGLGVGYNLATVLLFRTVIKCIQVKNQVFT